MSIPLMPVIEAIAAEAVVEAVDALVTPDMSMFLASRLH
jgi:hypothetical protein